MQIEPKEDVEGPRLYQDAQLDPLNRKETLFLTTLIAGVVAIAISASFSALAQVVPPTTEYSLWPAYNPEDRSFLCGESSTPPSGYADRMNGAIAQNLEYQRKRRPASVSEREVIESMRRAACPNQVQGEVRR